MMRGLGAEVKTDHGLLGLRHSVGVKMRLQKEIGVLRKGHRDAVGKECRRGAWHPSAQPAVERVGADHAEDRAEAGEARLTILLLACARRRWCR